MKSRIWMGAALAPVIASAQSVSVTPTDASEQPPTIVITATRTPVPVEESLAAVTVIEREQIQRAQATDVAEIIRFEAGIDLGRNGGPGSVTSAFIRGGESNHTLVLIDGIKANPATSGGAALQNIAPDMIERIEIVRGPRSTLYGSDAIGGVINIITRAAGEKPLATVTLRGGDDDTRDVSANLGWGDGDKSISLGIQEQRTEGDPSCVGSSTNRGFDNSSFNLRGSTRVGGKAELSARLWNAKGNAEYSSCGAFGSDRDQDFQNQVAAIGLSIEPMAGWQSVLTISRTEDDIRQRQENFLGQLDSVRTVRPMLDWLNVVRLDQHNRLSIGGSTQREQVDALSFGTLIDEDRDIHSGFIQNELQLARHRLTAAINFSDYEGFGNSVNWNVEYGYDLFAATRVIASAGTGFRAPDATDRFGFGGNPELDPEESTNYEIGLRQGIGRHHRIDLRAFHSEVDDLISVQFSDDNDPNVDFGFRAVNIDEYRNRGLELSWAFSTRNWDASLTGILQKPEDRQTGEVLLRRAEESVAARLARKFGSHYLALDVLGVGKRNDITADTGQATIGAGYGLLNLSAGFQLDRHFRLQTRIENLLDKDYETAAGFNQPGLTSYISLSYDL